MRLRRSEKGLPMLSMSAASEDHGMGQSGSASYFDGKTSARQRVTVELEPAALIIRAADGSAIDRWPYQELEQIASADGVLRLGRADRTQLARIEIHDPAIAGTIDELSIPVDRSGVLARRGRRKVVLFGMLAVVSVLLLAVFGVPQIATQLAPYVPYAVEERFGAAMEPQVRAMLDPGQQGKNFECGLADNEKAGHAALNALTARLETAAALPMPLKLIVVRKPEANAFALPGGHIYVFEGLITKAETPDELAGVIAHEIGHVAHRDGTRSVLQAAGLSFLFGLVLGDFVGGTAVIVAAKSVLQLAYSRQVEGAADRYALELMARAGGDGRALGTILERIAGAIEPGIKILLDHPETRERVAIINAHAGPKPSAPLLPAAQWGALKRICSGS